MKTIYIKILSLALIIIFFAGAFLLDSNSKPKIIDISQNQQDYKQLKKAPNIKLNLINGETKNLHDLQYKHIILNFWASWCAPCVIELPDMIELASNNPKLALVAISIDKNPDSITKFINKLKTKGIATEAKNIYWIHDKNRTISLKTFGTSKVPESIILDKDKNMIRKIVGVADWKNMKFD